MGFPESEAAADDSSRKKKRKEEEGNVRRRSRTESVSVSIDPAKQLDAHAKATQIGAQASREAVDTMDRALKSANERNDQLQDRCMKYVEKISELTEIIEKLRSKEGSSRQAELREETERLRIKVNGEVYNTLARGAGPALPQLVQKAVFLADRFLPTMLMAAQSGEKSPKAAFVRLITALYNPDPEGLGVDVLQGLQTLAGPEDWMLIQQMFAELAAQPPDRPMLPQNGAANGAAATNGAAH